jgi:predicted TIM-barrel fold metal-dependent hydrolase
MLGREFRDTKLLAACVRAYNNWACDYASAAPDRLKWAAALPMQDVEEAMKEARRAHEKGCVSYYMRPNPVRGGERMDTHVSGHILSHPFEAMAAMAGLIWYGIFEKFPKLKVVHVEADGGWVPYWLQRMEQHWDFSGNAEI